MMSLVHPIVILLILDSLTVGAIDNSDSSDFSQTPSKCSSSINRDNLTKKFKRSIVAKIHQPVINDAITARNKITVKKSSMKFNKSKTKPTKASNDVDTKMDKLGFIDLSTKPISKTDLESRERQRKQKKRMNQAAMALLMAYKLKFAVLIPTIIGGVILLIASTSLAGFFFALFAAVLGLKVH